MSFPPSREPSSRLFSCYITPQKCRSEAFKSKARGVCSDVAKALTEPLRRRYGMAALSLCLSLLVCLSLQAEVRRSMQELMLRYQKNVTVKSSAPYKKSAPARFNVRSEQGRFLWGAEGSTVTKGVRKRHFSERKWQVV